MSVIICDEIFRLTLKMTPVGNEFTRSKQLKRRLHVIGTNDWLRRALTLDELIKEGAKVVLKPILKPVLIKILV